MSEIMIIGVSTKVMEYRMLCGELPSIEDGLQALVVKPESLDEKSGWVQLYDEEPLDPWGRPFFYLVGPDYPDGFGVYSCGPDGLSDTLGNDPDDVNSWH